MRYKKVKKIKLSCKYCQKKFFGRPNTLYCSQNCCVLWNRYKKTKKEMHTKKCPWCNTIFLAKRSNDIFCSNKCREYNRRYKEKEKRKFFQLKTQKKAKKRCAWCNNEFSLERANQRCCCSVCYEKYYDYHSRDGDKARERARKYYKNNRDKIMANNYNISFKNYKEITTKCVICGFDEIVDCHHIIPIKEGGKNELNNYVGLCPNHHKLIHLRGYKITKEGEQWILKKKI